MKFSVFALTGAFIALANAQVAPPQKPLGIALEDIAYPRPVRFLEVENGGQKVRMAFQNALPPVGAKRRATTPVLLLHGKNFGGYYWKQTIDALSEQGFRVIVPDQIGFGKSSKPDINYSFEMLADNTARLLDTLKIPKVIVVGHSMGGMLAVKFARRFPARVEKLVLENPIGLEDYGAATGKVPLERLYADELKNTNPAKIRAFYKRYFVNWRAQFEALPAIPARVALSGEWPRWAKASAGTYRMILEQPVVGEFSQLRVPTLLIIGQRDRTVVGKSYMKPEVAVRFGDYPSLGKNSVRVIRGARLVEIPGVGHIPHLEAPDLFERALLKFILSQPK